MNQIKKIMNAMKAISKLTAGELPKSLKMTLDMAQKELLRLLDDQLLAKDIVQESKDPDNKLVSGYRPATPRDVKLEVVHRLKKGEKVKDIAEAVGYSVSAIYKIKNETM